MASIRRSPVYIALIVACFPSLSVCQVAFVECESSEAISATRGPAVAPLGDAGTSSNVVISLVDPSPAEKRVSKPLVDTNTGLVLGSLPQPVNPLQQVDAGAAIKQALEEGPITFSAAERSRQSGGAECNAALKSLKQVFETRRVVMHFPSNEEADLASFPAWYLTANQSDRDAAKPIIDEQLKFDQACMRREIPDEMNPTLVKRAVGVLMLDEMPFCSALRIAPDRILTARHCFLDQRTGKPTNDNAAAQQGKARFWFAYEAEPNRRFEICRPGLPKGGGGRIETQDDWLALTMARTAEPIAPLHWAEPQIGAGTSLYLRGYYVFAPERDALQKMRATAWGGCAATLVGGRCVFHACQTLAAMSGSPIFVRPEPQGTNMELTIVGIHLGPASLASQSLCSIEGSIVGKSNLGFLPKGSIQ